MTRRAQAVIGAAWGDEGKGLLTDALARPDTLVVRFNGGAQAGHTVQDPDGRRHVFHGVGSGTFRGAATYLSRFHVHNPLLHREEVAALHQLGLRPRIAADPRGMVTTPWDMMLNQMAEEARGAGRHGSCGLGLNETVTRTEAGIVLTAGDLADPVRLREVLEAIRRDWLPQRLDALGLRPGPAWQARLDSPGVRAAFLDAAAAFAAEVPMDPGAIAAHPGPVLFEGAQGLLLDAAHPWFPHVTRSRTGLTNVAVLAQEAGITALDVTYATRAYATRHGAGPFPREAAVTYPDATNVPNPWQGTLRFGDLDLDLLRDAMAADVAACPVPVSSRLAVTCVDQVGERVGFWHEGRAQVAAPDALLQVAHGLTCGDGLASYGPTRDTLREHEANCSPGQMRKLLAAAVAA